MSRGCLRTTISFSEWLIASITPESAKISPLLKKYESVCELAIPKRLTRAEIAMSKAATLWTLLCWIPIAERKTRLTGMKNCSKVTRASFGMTAVGQNSKNVYIKSTVLHERYKKRGKELTQSVQYKQWAPLDSFRSRKAREAYLVSSPATDTSKSS